MVFRPEGAVLYQEGNTREIKSPEGAALDGIIM